ncbi:MAG: type 1 glutamine amidotransferase domain-containing protein [Pseudomonadota bacterium]
MTHVLLLASNPATSPVTGWPIGFWWAELSHAWLAFHDAGYDITIASPEGGELQADPWSDPDHETGYAAHDVISAGFKTAPLTRDLIKATPKLADLSPDTFDAVFVAGGQGPMVTMIDDTATQDWIARFYEAGKMTGLVCHGTCLLLKTKLSDGSLLAEGKTWTGFADSEEQYVEHAAGMKIQPFWIETEAQKITDTNFITGGTMVPFAVRDGNLVTGQQQLSAAAAASKMIAALGSAN